MKRLKTLTLMKLKVITTTDKMTVKTASYSILIVRLTKVKKEALKTEKFTQTERLLKE
jgi:hypothetical protein